MKKLDELCLNGAQIELRFKWKTYETSPRLYSYMQRMYLEDGKLQKTIFGMDSSRPSEYVHLMGVTVVENGSGRKEKDVFSGNVIQTFGGFCLFEIAFNEKRVQKEIGGVQVEFRCEKKEYDVEKNVLVCHMVQADPSRQRIQSKVNQFWNQHEGLVKEVEEHNQKALWKVKQKLILEELTQKYNDLSKIRKLFGGQKLKEKYKISS